MNFEKTFIDGLIVISPKMFEDERGYFFESFNKKLAIEAGITEEFVQDNESFSKYGTLRGLHFQTGESAQSKLVRVIHGSVLDVSVDIRHGSPTFGKHFAIKLSGDNKKQIFIPKGFAHGFVTLSKEAILQYKCDNFYNNKAESGLNYSDKYLKIDWIVPEKDLIVNERDKNFQNMKEFLDNEQISLPRSTGY